MTRRAVYACVAAGAILFGGARVLAQGDGAPATPASTSEEVRLRLLTFGGFLGYLDGFPEYVSGPWVRDPGGPRVLGGVVGVKAWLASTPGAPTARLVTGNNMPRYRHNPTGVGAGISPTSADHLFWQQLETLNPSVVALGDDDLLRGVEADQGGSGLARLATHPRLKFLASNVFVQESEPGLNAVSSGGLTLVLPADQSVMPTDTLTIQCGARCGAVVRAVLRDLGPVSSRGPSGSPIRQAALDGELIDRGQNVRFSLDDFPLRPGRFYQLQAGSAQFAFRTSRPLTPGDDDLPIRKVQAEQASLVVAAFVSTDVKAAVPAAWWRWKRADAGAAPCFATTCEITVVPAADVWQWAEPLADPDGTAVRVALFENNGEDAAFLSSAPSMRIAIVAPETTALGRAGAQTEKKFSGDFGYHAVLNAGVDPRVTQVWVRPEWIGETVHTLEAKVQGRGASQAITSPDPKVEFVKGTPLRFGPAPAAAGATDGATPRVRYFVRDVDGAVLPVGPPEILFKPYTAKSVFSDGVAQGNLWTDTGALQAFLLDVAREATHADIAFLDSDSLDPAVVGWLRDTVEASGRDGVSWLSRFILERTVDRMSRIVKVDVSGSALVDLLEKAIARAKARDAQICIIGMGLSCPVDSVRQKSLTINARDIDARQFYSVALPADYAQALAPDGARHAEELRTLLGAAEQRFERWTGDVPTGCTALSELSKDSDCTTARAQVATAAPSSDDNASSLQSRLEERWDRKRRFTYRLDPAELEVKNTAVSQPEGAPLRGLPEEGRDVKEQFTFTGKLAGDVGVDLPRGWIVRFLGEAAYGLQRVGPERSYPSDDWKVGARLEWTVEKGVVHALFGGLTIDSQFRESRTLPKQATKKNMVGTITTIETLALTERDGAARFPRADAGVLGAQFEAFGAVTRQVRLTDVTVTYSHAARRKDVLALMIAGADVPADTLAKLGEQGAVDDAFETREAELRADPSVGYRVGGTSSDRVELAGTLTMTPKKLGSDSKAVVTGAFRYYANSPGSDRLFTPRRALDIKAQWNQRVFSRITLAPYVNLFSLWTKESNSRFTVVESGVKIVAPLFLSRGAGHSWR